MLLTALLALQVGTVAPPSDSGLITEARLDSIQAYRDSARHAAARARRSIALTPELVASAYRDDVARDIVLHAREARLAQDETLTSYDAMAKQRLTVGLGLGSTGIDKLLFRTENAARVRWKSGTGAIIDVVGARTAFPMIFSGSRVIEDMLDLDAIPYYPGREGLLRLSGVERASKTNEGLFIHPLDHGAEAYYQYSSGDSLVFTLPSGERIRLREVRVVAREPRSDLLVGALWFDVASAQLVRGAFRPAAPVDIVKLAEEDDPDAFKDVPVWVKPMIFPMRLDVAAFTVEYGLHEQRWWLPSVESVTGRAQVGKMRSPFSIEQSFRYASVNGIDTLPRVFASDEDSIMHLQGRGWMDREEQRRQRRDSIRAERKRHPEDDDDDMASLKCTPGDTITRREIRYGNTLPLEVRIPCDTAALLHSAELPPSIFDEGEQDFGMRDAKELASSLSMGLQPDWNPQRPTLHYGIDHDMVRYNRIEGPSIGVMAEQTLGAGYSGEAQFRIGLADQQPNGELKLSRTNGTRTYSIAGFRRLASANDWGNPFSLGSSLWAFVGGRDEGFYYRTWGGEVSVTQRTDATLVGRLFVERQSAADVEMDFSIPHMFDSSHNFLPNIDAPDATEVGLSGSYKRAFGLDPRGWRTNVWVRAEGALGTFDYSRGAADVTVAHGLGPHLDAALTVGAGTSGGTVPAQRDWFMGGTFTVRGQDAGTLQGDSFWMGRAELGTSFRGVRPVAFFDIGWAGSRSSWSTPGIPMSGAGLGASFLDGLMRADISHGIQPGHGWRLDLYTGASF